MPSLGRAHTRRIRRTFCIVGFLTATVIGLAAFPFLNDIARRGIIREGQVCAAVLEPQPQGELDGAVIRLLSQYPTLAAVATLDTFGNLASLIPDRQSFHQALQAALVRPGKPVRARALHEGTWRRAWAITVPLGGAQDASARRVALLLWDEAGNPVWLALLGIAVVATLGALVGCETHNGWFDLQVLQPIRQLRLSPETTRRARSSWMSTTANWHELEDITKQFRRVVLDAHRIEREASQQIDDDRKGFDRKLRRAEDLAMTDPLTGLHNRIFLEAELETLVRRQLDKGHELSVVMMDLDNFKDLNDANGHGAGDDLLRVAGELLKAAIRPTDFAVRLGGDEFLLLLPGADGDEATRIAERIIRLFKQRVRLIHTPKPISLSAGIASLKRDHAHTGPQLLHTADAALYRVKRNGKNGVKAGRV